MKVYFKNTLSAIGKQQTVLQRSEAPSKIHLVLLSSLDLSRFTIFSSLIYKQKLEDSLQISLGFQTNLSAGFRSLA